jgi:hypothetical protein
LVIEKGYLKTLTSLKKKKEKPSQLGAAASASSPSYCRLKRNLRLT